MLKTHFQIEIAQKFVCATHWSPKFVTSKYGQIFAKRGLFDGPDAKTVIVRKEIHRNDRKTYPFDHKKSLDAQFRRFRSNIGKTSRGGVCGCGALLLRGSKEWHPLPGLLARYSMRLLKTDNLSFFSRNLLFVLFQIRAVVRCLTTENPVKPNYRFKPHSVEGPSCDELPLYTGIAPRRHLPTWIGIGPETKDKALLAGHPM